LCVNVARAGQWTYAVEVYLVSVREARLTPTAPLIALLTEAAAAATTASRSVVFEALKSVRTPFDVCFRIATSGVPAVLAGSGLLIATNKMKRG
jgi:hypothetical protein